MNFSFKALKKVFLALMLGFTAIFLYPSPSYAALSAVGPIDPNSGFPLWYQDSNGLKLDLQEAADAFGISDPVDPNNPFSVQIGFNAEGFWWSADAGMDTASGRAILVNAMEAAFGGEAAVDGEQSAFGRIRIRIDVPEPGVIIVRHPYGTQVFNVDAVGPGFEINETSDIGCFAQPGVFSCTQATPPNFSTPLFSGIGPFLTWDTFNINPALQDPALKNPAPTYANRIYVGNPAIEHAITGSPAGQNFFRIEGPNIGGPGINSIQTNLFTVSGRLALTPDTTAPVVAEVTPVTTPAVDTTSDYTFSSTEAGTIIYGGDCSSATAAAVAGNNTVTFNALALGLHNNCTLTVTDAAANVSNVLNISPFTINAAPDADTVPPVITRIGAASVDVVINTPYTDAGATATDNVDGNITANIITTGLPVDTSTLGAKTVRYNVSDAAGNPATEVMRIVNVVAAPVTPPANAPTDVSGNQTQAGVEVRWNDTNDNETEFRILRRIGFRGDFIQIGTATANTTTFTDTTASTGVVFYQVTACNSAGCSPTSNQARVIVRSRVIIPPVSQDLRTPSNLRASNTPSGAVLTWRDRSTAETEFRIEKREGIRGTFTQIGTVPADIITFADPTPGIGLIQYRVTACNATACSPQSNVATIFIR